MTQIFNRHSELEKRRSLRRAAPEAEQLLWQHLRRAQVCGLPFRRQVSIDFFVVDFYCAKIRLVIEVDGPTHESESAQEHDALRQAFIESLGITFLRVTNADVYNSREAVIARITDTCQRLLTPPPAPSPSEREGE